MVLRIAGLLAWGLCCAPAAVAAGQSARPSCDEQSIEQALAALFPGSDWGDDCHLDADEPIACLRPVRRGGLSGFLPRSTARCTALPGGLALIGFELYLSEARQPRLDARPDRIPFDDRPYKIVSVVLYDLGKKRFVRRLDGFPLEENGWLCQGDVCSEIGLAAVEPAGGLGGCRFAAVDHLRGMLRYRRFYRICAQDVRALGDAVQVGEIGGQSGCSARAEARLDLDPSGAARSIRTVTCDASPECRELTACGREQRTDLAPLETAVRDRGEAAKLGGKRGLRLQWIEGRPGKAEVKKGADGLYRISGRQQDGKGNFLHLEGVLREIGARSFVLEGRIVTRIDHIAKGYTCVRDGKLSFHRRGKRPYWRLQQIDNPCDKVADYVDVLLRP